MNGAYSAKVEDFDLDGKLDIAAISFFPDFEYKPEACFVLFIGKKEIPESIKLLYRTVWEVSQKSIIDMAADRGAYICQSQSMNIHMQDATFGKLTSMHFHAWKKGLKTGLYYLRTKAAADAIKFTIVKDEKKSIEEKEKEQAAIECSVDNKDDCEMCGS